MLEISMEDDLLLLASDGTGDTLALFGSIKSSLCLHKTVFPQCTDSPAPRRLSSMTSS